MRHPPVVADILLQLQRVPLQPGRHFSPEHSAEVRLHVVVVLRFLPAFPTEERLVARCQPIKPLKLRMRRRHIVSDQLEALGHAVLEVCGQFQVRVFVCKWHFDELIHFISLQEAIIKFLSPVGFEEEHLHASQVIGVFVAECLVELAVQTAGVTLQQEVQRERVLLERLVDLRDHNYLLYHK